MQTLKGMSGSISVEPLGPGLHNVLLEPSERLWRVWGLILNAILPILPSCWGFSFALGCGISFFGGIQHSLVDGCSAAGCNFEVLSGENERRRRFLPYKAILNQWMFLLQILSPLNTSFGFHDISTYLCFLFLCWSCSVSRVISSTLSTARLWSGCWHLSSAFLTAPMEVL